MAAIYGCRYYQSAYLRTTPRHSLSDASPPVFAATSAPKFRWSGTVRLSRAKNGNRSLCCLHDRRLPRCAAAFSVGAGPHRHRVFGAHSGSLEHEQCFDHASSSSAHHLRALKPAMLTKGDMLTFKTNRGEITHGIQQKVAENGCCGEDTRSGDRRWAASSPILHHLLT